MKSATLTQEKVQEYVEKTLQTEDLEENSSTNMDQASPAE